MLRRTDQFATTEGSPCKYRPQDFDPGRRRQRIPDGLTSAVLSEVKNVQSLSYTQQLRDFSAYASDKGLRFDLYVRPGACLSRPLLNARASGQVNILEIPFR